MCCRMEPKLIEEKQILQRSNRRSYYCVARWCNNHNSNSIAMFRVPKGPRGKEWLRNAEREDLLHLDEAKLHRKYMCSRHFTPECFLKSNLLTWNAVPTLFTTFSKSPVPGKSVGCIPLAPKYFGNKQNGNTVMRNNLIPSRESQNGVLTLKNGIGNKDKMCFNSKVKPTLKIVDPMPPSKKSIAQVTCPEIAEVNEADHMVFLEEFSLLKQEPVLSCGTCGEIFLVESGLTQHRLRYHSDIGAKDVH